MMPFVEAKIAGCYVPRHVLRALRTCYPDVRLVWNYEVKRWGLLQDGSDRPFHMLGTPTRYEMPSMENTIKHMARMVKLRTKLERQRFLAELDATNPMNAAEKKSVESVREGNREMVRHVLQPRLMVTPWVTRSPHQS